MAIKTIRVFAEYTSDGYVPMPSQGNIDYGVTVGSSFPETQPSSYQTDDPNIDVAVTTMTDFYVWIRTHGSSWNPSYTRVVRVYPDSPSINSVVMNMIVAVGSGGTSISGGGGVNYYLNGGTSQGTLDGSTYYEMSKTPVTTAMVDFFKINTTGFENIAQFVTDAGDPGLLNIPAGSWPLGFYMSASNNTGAPKFYAEIYKFSAAGVFTLLGSSVSIPEVITNGQAINYYISSVTIPETNLLVTDRIAIRIFVNTDGNRQINLHTQDSHLSTVGTTFTRGLTAINGLIKQVQFLSIGNAGSDAAIVSSDDTHTINLPTASATKRGLLNGTDWSTFNAKQPSLSGDGFVKISGSTISYDNSSYQPLDGDLTAIGALEGTSGILKKTGANTWELDTTTYLSTGVAASTYQRLDKMVSNLLASDTEYPNSNAVLAKLALKANIENPQFTGSMNITGAESRVNFYDENNLRKYFIGYDGGTLRIYQDTGSASRFYINSSGKTFIPGDLEVGTIAKSGGTATQFLKADGSVDSSTYVTSASLSSYLLSSTAASTYQRLDKMVSNLLASDTEYPNSNAVIAALALKANAANPTFTGNFTISGAEPKLYFVDTDNNPDYTLGVDAGYFTIYDQTAGATRFSINSSGNISTGVGKSITAGSFVKDGGTASQYLMADGSVSTLTGLVTGSGATNYISKWTSASGLGNSILYDHGDAISVATTSNVNAVRLQVAASSSSWISGTFAGTGNADKVVIGNYLGPTIGGHNSALSAWVSLAINPEGGNVMIGTPTNSGYKFDVNGTGRFSGVLTIKTSSVGGSYYGGLIVEENGEAAIQIKGLNYSSIYFSDAANAIEAGIVYNHSTNNLELRGSGNSADLTIASNGGGLFSSTLQTNGNIGIRVAPSGAADQYLTTGDAGIAYTNTYFGTGSVRIGGGSDHVGNTVLSVAPGVVNFDRPGVGGGALKIFSSGNIGINQTTDSGFKLDINGSFRINGVNPSITTDSTTDYTIINARKNGTRTWQIDSVSGNFWLYMQGAANYALQISGSTGAASFLNTVTATSFNVADVIITSNQIYRNSSGEFYVNYSGTGNTILGNSIGRVGIGTTNPSEKFEVNGSIKATGRTVTGTSLGGVTLGYESSIGYLETWASSALVIRTYNYQSFNVSGTQYLKINTNGNILVNTNTDAGYNLYVNGRIACDTGSFHGIFGSIAASWAGGTAYPTIYGNTADRWVMYINPHVSYTQNGVNGFTGSMTGATLRMASDPAATNYWDVGIGVCSVGSDKFAIGRNATALFTITNTGNVTATAFFESSDIRLKTLIETNPIVDGIEKLEAKLYEKEGKIEMGYFAQDAELIMPYAVQKNHNGFLNLSYREVHTAKIARLEKEVAELKEKLNAA